jgi:hypothetical protein
MKSHAHPCWPTTSCTNQTVIWPSDADAPCPYRASRKNREAGTRSPGRGAPCRSLRDACQHIDQRRLPDTAGTVQEQHPERGGLGVVAVAGECVERAAQQLDLAGAADEPPPPRLPQLPPERPPLTHRIDRSPDPGTRGPRARGGHRNVRSMA